MVKIIRDKTPFFVFVTCDYDISDFCIILPLLFLNFSLSPWLADTKSGLVNQCKDTYESFFN